MRAVIVSESQGKQTKCTEAILHYTGSIFGLVQKSIQHNVNNFRGKRTGLDQTSPKLSCSRRIRSIFVLVW